jgi:ABC-type transporter Mla subunit MlaD
VGSLGKKAQDVDAMMRNYMALIEESLSAAENRSKEIGRVIAGQTNSAAQNLEQEIKKLEQSSDIQIAHAARAMREQHERAVASMTEAFAATAGGFQQTAQDMRATAQQVVKDIEFTRTELKRAILELPDETRSNADAMRRVVSDQITALNALAEVVRRQTNSMDMSGPGVYMPEGRAGK